MGHGVAKSCPISELVVQILPANANKNTIDLVLNMLQSLEHVFVIVLVKASVLR